MLMVNDAADTSRTAVFTCVGSFVYAVNVTSGMLTNRPGGNVTSTLVVWLDPDGVITTCPDTTAPDHEPFGKNVSGPHLPDPSPSTRNVADEDSRTAFSASGKLFESLGDGFEAQSVGSSSYQATGRPSWKLHVGEWKSVRVGIVVFFAMAGRIICTPAGSG